MTDAEVKDYWEHAKQVQAAYNTSVDSGKQAMAIAEQSMGAKYGTRNKPMTVRESIDQRINALQGELERLQSMRRKMESVLDVPASDVLGVLGG